MCGLQKRSRNCPTHNSTMQSAAESSTPGDDEVLVTATSGCFANQHLPHARENCVAFPFSKDKEKHCALCFCYCCDAPAYECSEWERHCSATHRDEMWQLQRQIRLQANPEHNVKGPGAPLRAGRHRSKRIQSDESSEDDTPGREKEQRPEVIQLESDSSDDDTPLSKRPKPLIQSNAARQTSTSTRYIRTNSQKAQRPRRRLKKKR
jgi:hypothetical protein